ncbi:MAG: cation:H+ antiporter [Frankiales bacterium]|nr:cation:H+ antiporter [Frankiales bacterium]
MIGALLLVAAAALLVGGAELFVENAAGAGRKLGLTTLAVGLLLAGAEPEELITAVIAAVRDRPGLAVGDAMGANITMLTACLGLAALARPLPVGRRVRSYAVMSAAASLLALAALADGRVGRLEGAGLLAGYALLVAAVWRREKAPPALGELAELEAEAEHHGDAFAGDRAGSHRSAAMGLGLALVGVAMMTAGGEAAVEGAIRVVKALGVEDTAVGLTILALATTVELFALLAAALRRGATEIAVAGVVGSATYNATATLGAAAVAAPLRTDAALAPVVLAAALPFALLALTPRGVLPRWAGGLLVLVYAAFVVLVFS